MALHFSCTHCGQKIVVNYLRSGEEALCPQCQKRTIIPPDAQGQTGSTYIPKIPQNNPDSGAENHQKPRKISEKELREGQRAARRAGFLFYVFSTPSATIFLISLSMFFVDEHWSFWIAAFSLLICSLLIWMGRAIRKHQPGIQAIGFVLAFFMLFLFPIGTLLGALALYYLNVATKCGIFEPPP